METIAYISWPSRSSTAECYTVISIKRSQQTNSSPALDLIRNSMLSATMIQPEPRSLGPPPNSVNSNSSSKNRSCPSIAETNSHDIVNQSFVLPGSSTPTSGSFGSYGSNEITGTRSSSLNSSTSTRRSSHESSESSPTPQLANMTQTRLFLILSRGNHSSPWPQWRSRTNVFNKHSVIYWPSVKASSTNATSRALSSARAGSSIPLARQLCSFEKLGKHWNGTSL